LQRETLFVVWLACLAAIVNARADQVNGNLNATCFFFPAINYTLTDLAINLRYIIFSRRLAGAAVIALLLPHALQTSKQIKYLIIKIIEVCTKLPNGRRRQ